jgi:hypothetical protein
MTKNGTEAAKYSLYCKEHIEEFVNLLREETNRTLTNWHARTPAALMAVSSLITFYVQLNWGNSLAGYALVTYAVPILIVSLYPISSILFSSIYKHCSIVIDLLYMTGLLSFCATLYIILEGTTNESLVTINNQYLQGQIAFVLALGTAFSFHASYLFTVLRNTVFTLVVSFAMYLVDPSFLQTNLLPILEGYFLGLTISWVFHDGIRARFYLKSTDADTRQHLYNQLSKLVYPHQLERIKLGDELENTIPLKEGKAIVNVFDVQRSSEIRHERTAEFFMNLFQSFLQICMKGYEHNPLRSQAFRLKETGDGFISSVGYPFLPIDFRSLADSAVATALTMFEAFNKEVERFNYSRPIKAAMGLDYNSVQGTFQSGGIRSYDLFGESLIQASKYEELRKQPIIWNIFLKAAAERGLVDFNVLIVQEVVYNSLSPSYRELFTEIDLKDKSLVGDFQMMYDNDARYIYFHLLE